MTHEPKPGEPKKHRTRAALARMGVAARSASDKVLEGWVSEKGIPGSKEQLVLARREADEAGGSLVPNQRTILDISSAILRGEPRPDGTSQDITHLVYVGDTLIAVVRNTSPGNGGYTKIDKVSLVELPYGHNKQFAGSSKDLSPARVVASVELAKLKNRVVDGAVQEWETTIVGRRDNEKPDLHMTKVSGDGRKGHFDFTVTADGRADITDMNSTNGTVIVTERILDNIIAGSASGSSDTEKLISDLRAYPTKFDPSLAGMLVPTPR